MSAYCHVSIELKGTHDELACMIKVLTDYENRSDVYIENVIVSNKPINPNKKNKVLSTLSQSALDKLLKAPLLYVSADGPYGEYGWLEEVDLFMELAKSAPFAEFMGNIYGSLTGGKQYLQGELSAKHLIIRSSFEDDNEEAPYLRYVKEKLPYEVFLELFKAEDCYPEAYDDWIEEFLADGFLYKCEYSDLGNVNFEEEEFEVIVSKVKALSIKTEDEFEEAQEWDSETVYDLSGE